MKNLSILHVVSDLDDRFGGPSKSVPLLASHLEKIGVENHIIFVATDPTRKDTNEVVDASGLSVTAVPLTFSRNLYYSSSMPRILKRIIGEGIDLVHIHSMWRWPAKQAWQAAKQAQIPHVISIRSNLYPASLKKNRWAKQVMRTLFVNAMIRSASFVHATEQKEVEAIRNTGFQDVKIVNIPNGISLIQLKNNCVLEDLEEMYKLPATNGKKRILFLSRIHPRKRLEDLLGAFAHQADKYREWDLWIAGSSEDKEYEKRIRINVREHGIEDRVFFLGMLTGQKKAAALKAADIFVLPSLFENFGIAIGEAMAAGLPVITTNGTPWLELPEKGAGWIVPPCNIAALASALDRAMSTTDEQRAYMGKRAQKIAQTFDWQAIANNMLHHYNQALKQNKL